MSDAHSGAARFWSVLGLILALAFLLRTGYVVAQPQSDPSFHAPALDGGYYLDWARRIAPGDLGVDGAPYLAPGYPVALAAIFAVVGERLLVLALLQQLAVLGAATLGAIWARRRVGDLAGWSVAALIAFQHATIFFAGRVSAESFFVLPAIAALVLLDRAERSGQSLLAGLLCGLSATGRPNLLALPVLWAGWLVLRRRPRIAALLLLGTALALTPLAVRNTIASGSFVPISSNAGITLYHGNGPGATGVYTRPQGFSGELSTQRDEATELARARSGDPELDAIEADRLWGRAAIESRLDDPLGSIGLALRRVALLVDSRESALGSNPALDANPWRATWRVAGELPWLPFGLVLGLALGGLAIRREAVGAEAWLAVVGAAAAPLLFYVSSRYRLPTATLLCLPAGVGLALMLSTAHRGRRRVAVAVAVAALVASLSMPNAAIHRMQRAGGLANLAAAYERSGRIDLAEQSAREAVAIEPGSVVAQFNLGRVLERVGRLDEAERAYRSANALDPTMVAPALNLGSLLVRQGRPHEALAPLTRAAKAHPGELALATNTIVALAAAGQRAQALAFAESRVREGLAIDPELIESLSAGGE